MTTPHLTTQLWPPLSTGQKLDASHNPLFHLLGDPLVSQRLPHFGCTLHLPLKVVEGQQVKVLGLLRLQNRGPVKILLGVNSSCKACYESVFC